MFFHSKVQQNAEKWKYCWLFEVGAMRNAHLKTVRKLWKEYDTVSFPVYTIDSRPVVQHGYSSVEEQ
jgi:hypothetical protein